MHLSQLTRKQTREFVWLYLPIEWHICFTNQILHMVYLFLHYSFILLWTTMYSKFSTYYWFHSLNEITIAMQNALFVFPRHKINETEMLRKVTIKGLWSTFLQLHLLDKCHIRSIKFGDFKIAQQKVCIKEHPFYVIYCIQRTVRTLHCAFHWSETVLHSITHENHI